MSPGMCLAYALVMTIRSVEKLPRIVETDKICYQELMRGCIIPAAWSLLFSRIISGNENESLTGFNLIPVFVVHFKYAAPECLWSLIYNSFKEVEEMYRVIVATLIADILYRIIFVLKQSFRMADTYFI